MGYNIYIIHEIYMYIFHVFFSHSSLDTWVISILCMYFECLAIHLTFYNGPDNTVSNGCMTSPHKDYIIYEPNA